jgi:catechol 2,3-dioxygenase-like lactoylglutathione lyase family enzyme
MRWYSLILVSAILASAPAFGQLAAPNAIGISMGHVHMIVPDPEPHKKLWVGIFGAQVTNAGTLEMLKLPGVYLMVAKARTAPAPTEGSDGSTVNHFGFLVKNYADVKAKLTAAGVGFATDTPAKKQLIANFPDKIRVEFTEDASINVPIKFHHIHVATTDQEGLRAWYVKMFGATGGMRGEWPNAMVPGGEVDFRKADTAAAPTKGRTLDHIGFEVVGLEAFCKKLEADGMKFDLTYRELPQLAGLKIAYILDPIGTRIELTEGLTAH